MQAQQLKSLVETGHYKPEPALVAEAMLQAPRRARAADRRTQSLRPSWSNPAGSSSRPPGSLISTPSPATTSPIRVSSLSPASPTRRRLGQPLGRAAPPAARSPRRPRRPARAGRGRRPRRPRRRPRRAAARRRRSAAATPLAAARWPASPPSPSLRSIIAVAPAAASARPAASRGVGLELARAAALGGRRGEPGASVGPLEQQQAGRGAAELAGEDQHVARPRAGAGDERSGVGAWPTTVTARVRTGARVTSPPASVVPVARGERDHPVEQLEAAVLVEVGRDAEDDVGLARLGAHRGQVGERGGQRLARRSARRLGAARGGSGRRRPARRPRSPWRRRGR